MSGEFYQRMRGYQPPFWVEYPEMQVILQAQGSVVDEIKTGRGEMMLDAFIMTMSEDRCKEWEKWLNLPPNGTLQDRRLAVLDFFNHLNKLTRSSIQTLVSQFYDGARSEVSAAHYTLRVIVKPRPGNDMVDLDLSLLEGQLEIRKPCHLTLDIQRWYCTWGDIKNNFSSWQNLKDRMPTWQHVKNFIPD